VNHSYKQREPETAAEVHLTGSYTISVSLCDKERKKKQNFT